MDLHHNIMNIYSFPSNSLKWISYRFKRHYAIGTGDLYVLYVYSLGQKFRTFKWDFFCSLPGGDGYLKPFVGSVTYPTACMF